MTSSPDQPLRHLPVSSFAPSRRTLLTGLAAMALPASASALPWSRDVHASAWEKGHHSAVRLLAGPRLANGDWLAGLEMQLDPGFKTYWRDPGDAGVPPVFDWTGSQGLRDVTVLWPVPSRFFDPSGHSNGYLTAPLFPLRIAADGSAPVRLALKLDYAVCEKLCIPAHAELALDWPADSAASPHATRIREAMARVPRLLAADASGPLSIAGAVLRMEAGSPVLAVTVRRSAEGVADLFVEAPSPWLWGLPQPAVGAGAGGTTLFEVPCHERAEGAQNVDLVLTAIAKGDAAETRLTIPVAI